jgi:hypothetical protein
MSYITGDIVAQRLFYNCHGDEFTQIRVTASCPQWFFQIDFLVSEQARPEMAVRHKPESVALLAEFMT